MKTQTIKKGRKGILHLPKFLKKRNSYTKEIQITKSMFLVDDSCDSGWSKLWGIFFLHIHYNSFRIAFRIKKGKMRLAAYAYVKGQKPYKNPDLLKEFDLDGIVIEPGDIIGIRIYFHEYTEFNVDVLATMEAVSCRKKLPLPKGWMWPVMEAYPHIKCKAKENIHFEIL